jgi:NADPH-dependent F420 reductase
MIGGTGKEGPGLALRWACAGYPILIGSRQIEKAQTTASTLNQKLIHGNIKGLVNADAVRKANICVLTVEQLAHEAALTSLKDDLQGKILVDATARVDFRNPTPPSPPSAGRIAQNILGSGVRVVAAFQNIPAHTLGKNINQPLDADVLVCADDLGAAEAVVKLAKAGGMRAYYAGGLDNGLIVESITALLICMNKHYGIRTASIGITGVSNL